MTTIRHKQWWGGLGGLLGLYNSADSHIIEGNEGVSDHGSLTGLLDDDHPQYLTADRGDARYIRGVVSNTAPVNPPVGFIWIRPVT
jgi:hypothetical protein